MSTSLTERRNETRVNVRIPLKYKLMGNQSAGEQIGESENVSQRGVFMWTAYPLEIGTQVELRLRMPSEVSPLAARSHRSSAHGVASTEIDSSALAAKSPPPSFVRGHESR